MESVGLRAKCRRALTLESLLQPRIVSTTAGLYCYTSIHAFGGGELVRLFDVSIKPARVVRAASQECLSIAEQGNYGYFFALRH